MGWRAVALLVASGLLWVGPLPAKDKKAKKAQESYAVIGGTVFREGFSLPGADVTLVKEGDPKPKPQKAISDGHGEFAFRVPVVPQTYILRVKRSGFASQEKSVAVSGEQRYEVNFNLEAEGK